MYVASLLKRKGDRLVTAQPATPISDVIKLLNLHSVGAVVIVDARHKLRGILSERDIVRALNAQGGAAVSLTAADLMTQGVITCSLSDTITSAMSVMNEHKVRHLPVLDNGRLVGVVSMRDVVNERLAEVEYDEELLREYVAGDYTLPHHPEAAEPTARHQWN